MSEAANGTVLCNDLMTNWINLTEDIVWITTGTTIAQIIILAWIELQREKHKTKIQWKLVRSSFNILLALLSLSLPVSNGLFYAYGTDSDVGISTASYIVSYCATFGLNIEYFLYAWGRGAPVFQVVAPRSVCWIQRYFALYTLIQVIQTVLNIVAFFIGNTPDDVAIVYGGYFTAIGIFQLEIFEIFVTYCYMRYLWNLQKEDNIKPDATLIILSRFGLASNALGILWLVCAIVAFYFPWDCSVSAVQNAGYLTLTAASNGILIIYISVQLWMKDALRRQEANITGNVVVAVKHDAGSTETKNQSSQPVKSSSSGGGGCGKIHGK